MKIDAIKTFNWHNGPEPEDYHDEYEADFDYDEEESEPRLLPQNDLLRDHRCQEMREEEYRRNKGRPSRDHRDFVIRHDGENWRLTNRGEGGMIVVQCPFCHHRLWTGNQVTIE